MNIVLKPYAIYRKGVLTYLGMHKDEEDCWRVALGWPSEKEIEEHKAKGKVCVEVKVTPVE